MILVWILPLKEINITSISVYFIRLSYIADTAVVISTYFYLRNLECRFQALNDFWTQLPDGLTTIPAIAGGWSNAEIVTMVDNIRRLHAELSDLLRIFSMGFGLMLFGFFVFNYINVIFIFFNWIHIDEYETTFELLTYLVYLQNAIFVMTVIIAASRVNDTKRKMISYLRLIKISILPVDVKLQVKFFMSQLSIFEVDKITAFGIFNINLNLVMSIIILLITGLTTLLQMKNQPFMLHFWNDTLQFYASFTKESQNTTSLS
ncbi:uncharacterized protein LOC111039366 [Myzus persicae]|uniref:uncharacterized protein LOC111039366 n=1 Tax=Myzus persicae TaxID=13164 RepID=UPI000B936E06|nr:uncharacterized protein LOC111039366 [Myzus persicae]